MATRRHYFAVVPAAGIGSRLGAALPKQYLEIAGRTVLEWSVASLAAVPWLDGIVVVCAVGDTRALALVGGWPRVVVRDIGGESRRDSVLAGAREVISRTGSSTWLFVHDAARPALDGRSLQRLREAVDAGNAPGAILAIPIADTVKRARQRLPAGSLASVEATVPRTDLWLAQTPQVFQAGALVEALVAHPDVTDEAAAMEAAGHAPVLVPGRRENFKVTTRDDLDAMRVLLESRAFPIAAAAADFMEGLE